ncbi:MAG: DoxX family protein [Deltaproteobacteria bacterium]|nr:MAG: DoxX family protein [Deltaproteobacteria bacterium]
MYIWFLIGRIMLGFYYLYSGVHGFTMLSALSEMAAAKGTPAPGFLVFVAHVLLIVAGVCILTGYKPVAGVIALVLFLLPVTFIMHAFWAEKPAAQMNQMIHFTKNLALLGSALMFLAIPRPWPYSIENYRMRKRVEARRTREALPA